MASVNQPSSARPSKATQRAVVSYRLARQRVIEAFKRGDCTVDEICDAQPELQRVANNCGSSCEDFCPVCAEQKLVTVTFAFGSGLPASGQPVTTLLEAKKLYERPKPSDWYVIEVCRSCWWNHLNETFTVS